jgi:hypothetical protein
MISETPSQLDEQTAEVRKLASELGLQADFFERLWLEDDWSFVLKLHALFEAALAHQIATRLNAPELRPIFARMQLNDRIAGKMAFLKAFDLVNDKYRRFLAQLSELRNVMIHDVQHVGFSFTSWKESLDAQQRRNAIESLCAGLTTDRERHFDENPKFVVWVSALCLLSMLGIGRRLIDIERDLAVREQVERHLNEIFGVASPA